MVDRLLGDFAEAGVLREVRNIPVHLAVHLYVLDHLVLVGLQAAVHIVELDAGDPAGSGVVKLGRQVLGQFVVLAVLFPAGDHIITLLGDHPVHLRDLFRGVLQVRVHRDDHTSLGLGETFVKGGGLAVVAAEGYSFDPLVAFCEFLDLRPRAVGAAVVDEEDFIFIAIGVHHAPDPRQKLRK